MRKRGHGQKLRLDLPGDEDRGFATARDFGIPM